MINRNLKQRSSRPLHVGVRVACAIVATLLGGSAAQAANHSDAPLIKLDPQVNLTDTYAFVGTKSDNPDVLVLNVVVQVRPFSEPGDGAIYDRFSPDARYSVNITDPATGVLLRRYDFRYSPVTTGYKRTDTVLSYGQALAPLGLGGQILNVGDENQNYTQTYTVTRVDVGKNGKERPTVIGSDLLTPPPNVGSRVTPLYNDELGRARSGAVTFAGLDLYTQQTIYNLPSGETVWSGHREDGFYSDIPGIFNLLDPRILVSGAEGDPEGETPPGIPSLGTDGFRGYNVLVYAIQIPLTDLPSLPYNVVNNATFFGPPVQLGVGVFASTARPRIRLVFDENPTGRFVQVQRLGNPIFNEGLVALQDKDNLNATAPTEDAQFATYALNPEIARLVNTIYLTPFQETGRTDLESIFIPEVLRVNTGTEPVRLAGQLGFNRLSTFGGDRTASGAPSGWPNGRRLGDDVSDILLTAIASGPSYVLLIPTGDSVPANDQLFNQVFPYAGTPNAGARNSKDSGENFGQ
ncbi:MAG: DUF4331 domain-containing protein [Chthoniobacterales bacterium]|nr:DUF4331 domain-containing protein [Chthoniobacterales bacterium]